MSKTLKTIQKISSISKTLSKVLFILTTVASILCLAAYICFVAGVDKIADLGNIQIYGLLGNTENLVKGEIMAKLAAGFIITTAEAVLCRFSQKYFENELVVGTPFTFEGAKEIRRLGILSIAVPIGSYIVADIIAAVICNLTGVEKVVLDVDNGGAVTIGIMFIIMSLIFKYGAELKENKNA